MSASYYEQLEKEIVCLSDSPSSKLNALSRLGEIIPPNYFTQKRGRKNRFISIKRELVQNEFNTQGWNLNLAYRFRFQLQ